MMAYRTAVRRMLPLLTLVSVAPAATPYREVKYLYEDHGDAAVLLFDKGYLFISRPRQHLMLYDRDGKLVFHIAPGLANGATVIFGAAIDSDGNRIAVADENKGQNRILFLDRSGHQTASIETGEYLPASVCFDENHTVWTFGWQRLPDEISDRTEYLLRKYPQQGTGFRTFLPRSVFAGGVGPAVRIGLGGLRSARDRIGALTYPIDTQGGDLEFVEVNLSGDLLGHWKLGFGRPTFSPGLALTSSGTLYTMALNPEHNAWRLSSFDRNSAAWRLTGDFLRIGPQEANQLMLLGADGDDLVFALRRPGEIILRWLKPTK